MTLRPEWVDNVLFWRESTTGETVSAVAPVSYCEEFLGKALDTTNWWTALDTGAATEAIVADSPNGEYDLTLDTTNEVQLAGLYWGDHRPLVLNQGLTIEWRVSLPVLPTGSVVAVWGLCGDHNAATDTVAESIWFRVDGSGAVKVESDDTANNNDDIATGTTVIENQDIICRIECETTSAIRFFINGSRVASGTTFDMSTVAALALQPVARIGKEGAAATVGTLRLDYCRIWQHRSAT